MRSIILLVLVIISFVAGLSLIQFLSNPFSYEFNLPSKFSINPEEPYMFGKIVAKEFPRKYSGSKDAENLAFWLGDTLRSWGYNVTIQEFKAKLGNETILRNVIAFKQGLSEEQILILTNYDQAPTSLESASDTSAAVGAVLALAHSIANEKLNRSIVFAFVDGEEWGMIGADYLAKNYPFKTLPKAALVVEDAGVGELVAITADPIGQFSGYSPLWLRELIKACAINEKFGFVQPLGFDEYAQRAVLISFTDQGPLLKHRIQAIQIGGYSQNTELAREVYHTEKDVYEHILPESVYGYSKVIECALKAIDNMVEIKEEQSYYFMVSESKVVGPFILSLAQVILLLPLYARAVFSFSSVRKESLKELIGYLFVFLALLASYAFAKSLPFIGIMPYYELYPPPPRHPLLYQPNYLAMFLWFFVTALLLYLALKFASKFKYENSLDFSFIILAILSIIALIYNPFAATLLFLPAAYSWIFVDFRKSLKGKIANIFLILLGGLVVYLLVYVYSQMILLDPFLMLWYLFMGVSYNLFTPISMILYISILTVGIRLLFVSLKDNF